MCGRIGGWIAIICLLVAPRLFAEPTASVAPAPDQQPLHTFSQAEWIVSPGDSYANPFDPDEVQIDGIFLGPGNRRIVLPAFWRQVFINNRFGHHEALKATAAGDGRWTLRFAPTAPGEWTLHVRVKDRSGERESDQTTFSVAADESARGFVRRAENNRYLRFDSGKSFFPIGCNIAWPHAEGGLDEYESWFGKLSAGGGNFARVWMSHPNRMTETIDAGPGRFDLPAMQYYDEILEIARRSGILVMFTLNNHRDLLAHDQYGDSIWLRFPYNSANGGPATQPADFVNSKACRELYKRRLRYLIGRYSSFTNLAFWEFFNEQEFTKIDIPTDWLREMSQYLKDNDPYQHLVTESSKLPDAQWQLPGIDMTQSHLYVGGSTDLVGPIAASARRHDRFRKPHVVAELGVGGDITEERYDPAGTGNILHQGIWASALAGCAGSSWAWWWDNYIGPKDLWHVYGGLSRFAASVDWAHRRFEPLQLEPPLSPLVGEDRFYDLTLPCTENWGYVLNSDVTVDVNGALNQAMPHYWVSPTKPDLFRPAKLHVDLPHETTMAIRVAQVSDVAVVRVSIDGKPAVDFPFSALPGAPDVKRTRPNGNGETYSATLDIERTVQIPPGKHVVTVQTVAGDWVSLESIVFRQAQSAMNQLAALALADAASGETIAWVYDTQAHWRADRDGVPPRKFDAATLVIPVATDDPRRVQWWDTRTGSVIAQSTESPGQGKLKLTIPPFERDIALRVGSVR